MEAAQRRVAVLTAHISPSSTDSGSPAATPCSGSGYGGRVTNAWTEPVGLGNTLNTQGKVVAVSTFMAGRNGGGGGSAADCCDSHASPGLSAVECSGSGEDLAELHASPCSREYEAVALGYAADNNSSDACGSSLSTAPCASKTMNTSGETVDIEELVEGCGPGGRRTQECGTCSSCGGGGAGGSADEPGPLMNTLNFDTEGLPLRARSRFAGPNGNFWYPAVLGENLAPGSVDSVVFWKTNIAVWRTPSGELHAVEDRCAHRQLRLSKGFVEGDNLTCCYHGWEYNGDGVVVKVAHEIPKSFKRLPRIAIRTYPVVEKYGIVFIFPGDPALADVVPLPEIPWLDQANPVPFKHVDITVNAHFTMIIENNCDFYHAFLHRKYAPFTWPELQSVESDGDAVNVIYKTDMGQGSTAKWFADTKTEDKNLMKLWFDYPCQRSNLEDKYKHWMFSMPINERLTRTFYIFLWEKMEFAGMNIPYSVRTPIIWGVHKWYLLPVLLQDLYALEEEQKMNDEHCTKNSNELNPLVSAFQRLAVRKWAEYLESEKERASKLSARKWRFTHGAGLTDYRWADYK